MTDSAERRTHLPQASDRLDDPALARRAGMPHWAVTTISLVVMLAAWEFFGRDINPVFGSYPSAIAVAFWELTTLGPARQRAAPEPAAFRRGYALAIAVGVPLGLVDRPLPRRRGGDRHLCHRRLCHAARRTGAAPDAVAGARLRGQGGGGDADVGVPDLHQHLARRRRGAQEPDRCRQILRRLGPHHPAPHRAAGDACLTSWPASGSRSAAPWWP